MNGYLSKREAAAHAGVCEKTIDNWRAGGHLQTFRRGRLVYVSLRELDDWLDTWLTPVPE